MHCFFDRQNWASAVVGLAPLVRPLIVTVVVLGLVSITGCSGCQSETDDQKKEKQTQAQKEKKKKLPDFESMPPVAMPGLLNEPEKMKRRKSALRDDPIQKEIERLRLESYRKNRFKPGHWQDVRFQARANHYNIEGQLYAGAVAVGGLGQSFLPVQGTRYMPLTKRPAALPKGPWKTFESSMFFPLRQSSVSTGTLQVGLERYNGLQTLFYGIGSIRAMFPDQHHLLLLTNRQDNFRFLAAQPTVRLPGSITLDSTRDRYHPASYVVIASNPAFPPPVPRHALNWTTIAYLIWDDFSPEQLDADQQQALIDWIHFGGQLILSGPDCLERLEKGFLGDYLPARAETAASLTDKDLKNFNAAFSLPEKNAAGKTRDLQALESSPLLGLRLEPHSDAKYLSDSSQLVIERQLGRGRIVATSFSLSAPQVRAWRSFDSFLNNVLLRRKPRTFYRRDDYDGFLADTKLFRWNDDAAPMRDPLLYSSLRFLTRDLSEVGTPQIAELDFMLTFFDDETDEVQPSVTNPVSTVDSTGKRELDDVWHYGGYDIDPVAGVGSWNDFRGVAVAARSTLQDAAGISPPSGNFVLQMLVCYLFVLVPVNWLLFWSIGKVEYAWIAAPFIAIIGALVVIRMASLDIGFSRSNTQVALLEIPTDYQRGHLTEYSALYTSLSTGYRVKLDGPASQALPFPAQPNAAPVNETNLPVAINRSTDHELTGLQNQSNSTELLHAEHLLDVGGPIRMTFDDNGNATLVNQSTVTLNHVLVAGGLPAAVKADESSNTDVWTPQYKFCLIDEIPAGGSINIQFQQDQELLAQYRKHRLMFNARRTANQIWTQQFADNESCQLDTLSNVPALQAQWPELSNRLLQQQLGSASIVNKQTFFEAYEQVNPTPYVSLGRVFDCVFDNLTLDVGHYRLYATTEQKLGQTEFFPSSTQSDRQTLIVAHLNHPQLPSLGRDTNTYSDLINKSDLDQKKLEIFE